MITGPPPKFHETRDILLGWADLDHEWAEADNVASVRAGIPGVPQRSAQVALGARTAEIEAEAAE